MRVLLVTVPIEAARSGTRGLGRAAAATRSVCPTAGVNRGRGQSLAEFALVLVPLTFILLGIIQMGFIFNAYVTVSNATREGAREASIYVYDHNSSQTSNDAARAAVARQAVKDTMGLLSRTSPHLTDGDIVISYSNPAGAPATSQRKGWHVTVRVTYHLDLLLPMIASLMPRDGAGRMPIISEGTMVIN